MIPDRRIFQVRQGRPLFYVDVRDPNSGRGESVELWASPGEYVDAWHPVLREIAQVQAHKVRPLKVGDVIPAGSILHVEVVSAAVRARIRAFDGTGGSARPVLAQDLVVAPDGSAVPASEHTPA